MNEALAFRANMLQKSAEEIEENLSYIDSQISELESFKKSISFFSDSKEEDIISSIGRGVFLKSSLTDREFLVDVGANVLVKKNPKETEDIIENQISRIKEARLSLLSRLDLIRTEFNKIVLKIEEEENTSKSI